MLRRIALIQAAGMRKINDFYYQLLDNIKILRYFEIVSRDRNT